MALRLPQVLLIENDSDIRDALRMNLSEMFEVVAVPDGASAVPHLRNARVVVVDLHAANFDALLIAARAATPAVPFILMSTSQDATVRAAGMGAAAVIRKPFSMEVLESQIQKLAA